MKFLVVIQARMGASRLPGKVLMELQGKSVLRHVVSRVSKAKCIDEVVVATTCGKEDIPVVREVSGLGVRVFAGSESDVLDRYYQVARLLQPQYVVRVTADCPLFDAPLLDEAIHQLRPETDYLGMISETFPDGLDIEIMRFSALKTAWENARLASEREHVTPYIKNHPEIFHIQDFICPLGNLHDERWTLDEPQDYAFIKVIYEQLYHSSESDFWYGDILSYLEKHPDLHTLNQGIVRNEGLLKSLKADIEI